MPAPGIPLVGRDAEFAILVEALRAAGAGTPQTVIVSGEAGIGKTRLVEEAVAWATDAGFLVATGQCSPVSATRLPYGPLADLVGDLRRQRPEIADAVSPEVWRGVAPLTGSDAPAAASDLSFGATRLFAGFVELIGVLAPQPMVLIIEDVHWADPASMDLIGFACRKLRGECILAVLTSRSAGTRSRSASRSVLAELRRLPNTAEISLPPLSEASTRELVGRLPDTTTPSRLDAISALSEGNPFFVLHLARHADGNGVPPQLRDVLLSTLDDLSDDQRSVLLVLTILGDRPQLSLMMSAVGQAPDRFSTSVRELVNRGLVVVQEATLGFRHALLREVMIDDTLPSERIVAHARAADTLLASPAAEQPARAAQLAHHLLECGRHPDAIRYAIVAARHATGVWAFEDARRMYAAVRRLWPLVRDPDIATGTSHATVLRESALACRWCGALSESLQLLQEALAVEHLGEIDIAEIEQARGQVLWASGEMGEALAAYRRAAALLPATADGTVRAGVLAALAHGLMATGQARDALETAESAARLAAEAGAGRIRIHATITAAAARAQLGEGDVAVDALRGCLPEVHRLDDLELVLRCYGNLTFALGIECRYGEVADAAAAAMQICGRYGPVVSLASTLVNNRVGALIALGRWDEADETARAALAEVPEGGVALHLRMLLAGVAVARGDSVAAGEQLALVHEQGQDNPYVLSKSMVVTAEQALWSHDPEGAATIIAGALPGLQAKDDELLVLDSCWLGLRAAADIAEATVPLRRAGATAGPDKLLQDARDAATRTTLPVAAALLLACEAEAARITASDRTADWAAAADAHNRLDRPYPRAYCLMRLGTVSLRTQARSAAAGALSSALRTAQELGARPLADQIGTLVTISGLRLPEAPVQAAPTTSTPFGLTPRERQIVSMLTTGSTNRVIARKLFISERTAGVHVSNILAKLGVANRTEAARMALRHHLDTAYGPEDSGRGE